MATFDVAAVALGDFLRRDDDLAASRDDRYRRSSSSTGGEALPTATNSNSDRGTAEGTSIIEIWWAVPRHEKTPRYKKDYSYQYVDETV